MQMTVWIAHTGVTLRTPQFFLFVFNMIIHVVLLIRIPIFQTPRPVRGTLLPLDRPDTPGDLHCLRMGKLVGLHIYWKNILQRL